MLEPGAAGRLTDLEDLGREATDGRGDVTHRTLLGAGAIRQLAEEAELQVVDVRAPAFPVVGLGGVRAIRRLVVRGLRSATDLVVGRLLMATTSSVATPNMVAVLQQRRASQ